MQMSFCLVISETGWMLASPSTTSVYGLLAGCQAINSLIGRIQRFYRKRTDFVPRLHTDVRGILDRDAEDQQFLLRLRKGGALQAHASDEIMQVQGLMNLRDKHLQCMIAYNHATGPDFDMAHLTDLLDYHTWVLSKALDVPFKKRPTIAALMEADLQMRTRWMLSWRQREFPTFSETIKHHRGQSAFLFSDMNRQAPDSGRQQSESSSQRTPGDQRRNRSRSERRQGRSKVHQGNVSADEWKGLERFNPRTKGHRCQFYNKRGGCRRGAACPDAHECDFPGCGMKHPRIEFHPMPERR